MSKPAARSFRIVCEDSHTTAVEALLRAQGYEFEPEPFSPLCRRLLAEPRPLGSSLAAFFGYIYIQDRSSMLPPVALAPAVGASVLDMCASPGSKTGFLAQLVGRTGFVLGNEPSPTRLGTLRANLHQCNLIQAATCSYSGDALPLHPHSWNAILLDPPCSGWGTAEKHPQVLKLWQGDKLDTLTSLQQRLLRHAARLLAPGGSLVYSTCTTNVAENEDQVRFAEEELGLVREHLAPIPGFVWEELPGGEGTLRVDGARSQAQGFYVARLRKPGSMPDGGAGSASDNGPDSKMESGMDSGPDAASGNADGFSPRSVSDSEFPGSSRFGRKRAGRASRQAPGQSPGQAQAQALGQALPLDCLAGPTCDPALLPPGEAVLYGEHVRFIPAQAAALLPQNCIWQGALLGKLGGGRLDAAPRLRALMPEKPDAASSLVLEDINDISALLSGQSRQTGLQGREAALWWRDLPLGRVALKQGRAVAGFR
ncbi:MAG: RNA methyltransferase [Desulfovibrio sp. MES5]|uniref:RsmB/NOP family class I SAM-dependent RNA methyltransferase n=1 Tax=Desulfovibrio sp. MES5 TaxID=1899016 RepID=UPI000B9CDE74|nr:RsmB/NOP family class I SAM-dependent RNA methyltransferase [Desulfovibrio sp. MES5]OXS28148.1 MAG: RNA methyltransferase [Desulfovibrio sp. MES5]